LAEVEPRGRALGSVQSKLYSSGTKFTVVAPIKLVDRGTQNE